MHACMYVGYACILVRLSSVIHTQKMVIKYIHCWIGPQWKYDFMQMRYSCQLLSIYPFAFISECGFCRCVVLSYDGSIAFRPLQMTNHTID